LEMGNHPLFGRQNLGWGSHCQQPTRRWAGSPTKESPRKGHRQKPCLPLVPRELGLEVLVCHWLLPGVLCLIPLVCLIDQGELVLQELLDAHALRALRTTELVREGHRINPGDQFFLLGGFLFSWGAVGATELPSCAVLKRKFLWINRLTFYNRSQGGQYGLNTSLQFLLTHELLSINNAIIMTLILYTTLLLLSIHYIHTYAWQSINN